MRNAMIGLLSGLLLAMTSLPLLAMSHEDQSMAEHQGHTLPAAMDHGSRSHEGMEFGGMADMQGLGECLRDNVHSRAEIKAYGAEAVASMAKLGMAGTHHFMVYFNDMTGTELVDGLVALRIKRPDGNKSAPIKLLGMGKGFGADIVLDATGQYDLEVGTKLKDGKKRVFEYFYEVN
jgi:hypothetical protein